MSGADRAAAGPLAAGHQDVYRRLISEIERGATLHYETVAESVDPDLDLLLGDQAYAAGLSMLAELGDLAATMQLADVISLVAAAHADQDTELAAAAWDAGATAVGWGTSPAIEDAKMAARARANGAAQALRAAAAERRNDGA